MGMEMNSTPAYARLVVIVPKFSHWHGTRVMKSSDYLVFDASKLPPSQTVKDLGRQYQIDPKNLREFVTLRKHAFNTLAAAGIRFMGGYAIPQSQAASVMETLDSLKRRYEKATERFIAHYDRYIDEWADSNPEIAGSIRSGKLSQSDVAQRFASGYSAVKLAPLSGREDELERSVRELKNDVIAEAVNAAKKAHKDFVEGNNDSSRYLKTRLVRAVDKLGSLSFLHEDVERLYASASDAVRQIPDGALEGDAFNCAARAAEMIVSEGTRVAER